MKHYNTSFAEEGTKIFNLHDSFFTDVDGFIANVPVLPRINIARGSTGAVSGALTAVYTTPTDRDFYLTGVTMSFAKDAVCDVASAVMTLSIRIDGAPAQIAQLPMLTLTAQSGVVSVSFPIPIRVDRGFAINTNTQTFTVGLLQRACTITGYTI